MFQKKNSQSKWRLKLDSFPFAFTVRMIEH